MKPKVFDEKNFCTVYRKHIDENNKIFKRFLKFISDEKQLNEMFFLNDEYHIPPADYFTRKNKDIIGVEIADNRNIKQYIGAYFGYLFKFTYKELNYRAVQVKFAKDSRYVLSSASYYEKQGNIDN